MGENIKLEFIARITTADGQVIECTAEAKDGIPAFDDFNMGSKMEFLESFDVYEKAALEARNKAGEEITAEYLAEVSKKKEKG